MEKRIVFLKTGDDLKQARAEKLLEGSDIIILSYSLFPILKEENIPFTPIWEFCSHDQLLEALDNEKRIIEQFWLPFCEVSGLNEEALVPLFQLIYFLDEALVAGIFAESIIAKLKPAQVVNFVPEKDIPCKEGAWSSTVFDSVLNYRCTKHGVHYKPLPRTKNGAEGNTAISSSPVQHLLQYFQGFIAAPFEGMKFRLHKKSTTVSLVSEKEKRERHSWIHEKYEREYNQVVVNLLSDPKLIPINVYSKGFCSKLRSKKRIQQRFASIKEQFHVYKNASGLFPDILGNPHLDFHWEDVLKILVVNTENARRRLKKIIRIYKPENIIISQAHQAITIALTIAFHRYGGKTLLVQHATIPYAHKDFYLIHNQVHVSGKYQLLKMLHYGLQKNSLYQTNDERYKNEGWVDSDVLRKKYDIQDEETITIVTRNSQAGAGYFPKWDVTISMDHTMKFLLAASGLPQGVENRTVIFKSHPNRDYYDMYNTFARSPKVKHYRREPIKDLIQLSDVMIFIGPITDALLEALVHNKKIIICNSGLDAELVEVFKKEITIVNNPDLLKKEVGRILQEQNPVYEHIHNMLLRVN